MRLAFLVYLILMSFTFTKAKGDSPLIALPKQRNWSVCTGKSITLEVILQDDAMPFIVNWRHEEAVMDDVSHFSRSKNGRILYITDVLPPHAGVYKAYVSSSSGQSAEVTFVVEITDVHVRSLVSSHLSIEEGQDGFLRVEVPQVEDDEIWWLHNGELIDFAEEGSAYSLTDTQDDAESVLKIESSKEHHAGVYEAVVKSGACQAQTMIKVEIAPAIKSDTSNEGGIIQAILSGADSDTITRGVIILGPTLLLTLIGSLVLIRRKKKSIRHLQQVEVNEYYDDE
ncbi:uncharacterized protein LOC116604252 [Nematostella vectensis]|uniref:uncharacterized protein LOC116604252 n=1 Tax=Nematostella vectensis TaxID=45351 RepID=UPI0020778CAE|nr:uncharacterized protein LOC116604252 [Nematostella vectensis]